MKAIVLENGFVRDIPESLTSYLEHEKVEWEWYDMRERFWPENKDKTIAYFSSLPKGQVFYCHTVFDGYDQLELMILLLHKLKDKKFTIYIANNSLCDEFMEFYNSWRSSISPEEYEDDNNTERIKAFKSVMNARFVEVLQAHKIIWLIGSFRVRENFQLKNLEDVRKGCHEK